MENGEDLFSSKLNEEGSIYLRKVYQITRWLVIIGVLSSLLSLTLGAIQYFVYAGQLSGNDSLYYFQRYVYFIVEGFVIVLFLVQLIIYFSFVKKIKKALLVDDQDLLRRSFRTLYVSSVIAVVGNIFNLFILAGLVFVHLEYLSGSAF